MKIVYLDIENDLTEEQDVLERTLEGQVLFFKDFEDFITKSEILDSTDILVFNFDLCDTENKKVSQLLEKRIQFLALVTTTASKTEEHKKFLSTYPQIKTIKKPLKAKDLSKQILKLCGEVKDTCLTEFFPIAASRLSFFTSAEVNIHLRLSSDKFVKVLNEGDAFNSEFIKKYQRKGVEKFYIEKDQYDAFRKFLSSKLNSMSSSSKAGEVVDIQGAFLSTVHQKVQELGVSAEIMKEVDTLTESSLKILKSNKDLGSLLQKFFDNKDYFYSHAIFNSYLCGGIIQEMDWNTPSTFQKLINACLLHDLSLDDEKLHVSLDGPEKEKLSWKEIKKIKNHPIVMSELIIKAKGIPADVDKIILNHHEKPDGSGFPKGMNAQNIFPLACIFIVAEEFIERLGDEPIDKARINQILTEMEKLYKKGNFKAPFDGLKKLVA
jgi:HD-GYP domain-containing protein (c-di-GMP phosphodiesterase class II)